MDLTRLGRSYVATGDTKYRDAYWDIVKWRNGDIERPDYVVLNSIVSSFTLKVCSSNHYIID